MANKVKPVPDGRLMRAQTTIGDSAVMLVDERPQCGMVGPDEMQPALRNRPPTQARP
jgi:uncharacterized glyoxalase superfamily protein PhnB